MPRTADINKPPKNAIRCDCRHQYRQCYETQLQLFRRDPSSKFFGFSRVRIPPFIKRPFDEANLTVQESKKLLVIKSLVAHLGIRQEKLMKADVVHISKHHWREAAVDFVAAKGDKFSMTHIFEFASREEWLRANTLEENANVFAVRPKFKAFLAPNRGVEEWPLLYENLDRSGGNNFNSGHTAENGDRKPPPESLCDDFLRGDNISSRDTAMFSEQPGICSQKKGARKDEESKREAHFMNNKSAVYGNHFIDNKSVINGNHSLAQSIQQPLISQECSAQNWEAPEDHFQSNYGRTTGTSADNFNLHKDHRPEFKEAVHPRRPSIQKKGVRKDEESKWEGHFINNKSIVYGNHFIDNKSFVSGIHPLAQSIQQQMSNISQECGAQNWEAPTNHFQSNYERTTGTSADNFNFHKDHRPEFKEAEHPRRRSSCSDWEGSFVDHLDGSVCNAIENQLGSELDLFSLDGNDNELGVGTLKSSHRMDSSKSWAGTEVALQAVEEQKTLDEADTTNNLQSVWQDSVGINAKCPPPHPIAAAGIIDVPLKQWIKYARLSIGSNDGKAVASLKFLRPALTIATCIAEQISRSEDTMDVAVNWAKCVVVRIKHDGCVNIQTPHASFPESTQEEKVPDLNQQLDELLESYANGSEMFDAARSYEHASSASASSTQKTKEPYHDASLEHLQALNFLDVHSAEFQCLDTEADSIYNSSINVDENSNKARRIYNLGLVFYELFSGGQIPPPTLYALASFDGAFISLSTTTLVKRTNEPSMEAKRHQGSTKSEAEVGLCQLSFEYLRLIGVPNPICGVIYNMMDCVYGDLSGRECYSTLDEVIFDLQLMIDKPSKFLRGLDMDNVPSFVTQLNEIKILRHQEFEDIMSCHRRCVEGSCEIAIIQGESGSGKSWISQNVASFIVAQGGIVVTGKFDQMKQAKPFSAIATAFDSFIDVLIRSKHESLWAKDIIDKLQEVLGDDGRHLMYVIPRLSFTIESDACQSARASSLLDTIAHNSVQLLHHLFCQFLEVITTNAQVSLTLCLDDIQWADKASIDLLNRLIMQRNKKFFFLGCCRGDEMESDHPVEHMLKHLRQAKIKATAVHLNPIEEDTLNTIMSELLSLSPRLVRPLSRIIHSKTRGNILFFSQLMLSLHREGLIYLDFSKERWAWDEEKILSMKLPENVAICFTNGINKLPLDEELALHSLSLFGASVRIDYLELLERQLGLKLLDPLKRAAADGMVIKQAGCFRFCHDRIQEASFNMIGGQARQGNHLMYGRCLVRRAGEIGDDDMLFTAINQINLAGRTAISNADECYTMANYNLIAGKRAMTSSAFSVAYSLLESGIGFLGNDHWQTHYKFSLTLYELACQSALAVADINGLNRLFDEAMKHAKCFDDKLNLQFIHVSSLAYSSNGIMALESGLAVLSDLGEEISNKPSQEVLDYNIQHTQSMLDGVSEREILNYRMMTNTRTIAVMKFLARLQSIAFVVKPDLSSFMILKMVQITVAEGLCPSSPFGFACFGSFIAQMGNIAAGHRFVLLAKSLLNKVDERETAGDLLCVLAEVHAFVEPVQAANELRAQGETASLRVGDVHTACLCRLQYCIGLLWAGSNLHVLQEKITAAELFTTRHEHKTWLVPLYIAQRSVNILVGNESHTLTFNELLERRDAVLNIRQKMILSFHNLYLSLVYDSDSLKEQCEAFFSTKRTFSLIMYADSVRVFITGLSASKIFRQTGDEVWADRSKMCIEQMQNWVNQGVPWNFKQKLLLMQAEDNYSNGNLQTARDLYSSAITCAKQHRFLNDESLACEMAAKFYLETGHQSLSLQHFRLAHETYIAWGALGKANCLFEYTNRTFSSFLSNT